MNSQAEHPRAAACRLLLEKLLPTLPLRAPADPDTTTVFVAEAGACGGWDYKVFVVSYRDLERLARRPAAELRAEAQKTQGLPVFSVFLDGDAIVLVELSSLHLVSGEAHA